MKKTWLSYLLWLVYALAAVILSASYLSTAGTGLWGANKYAVPICGCLGIAAAMAIWFAGRRAAGKLEGRFCQDEYSRKTVEYALTAGILAAFVFYRVYWLGFLDVPAKSIYYDMALVKDSGGVPELAHGAAYLYTSVLSTVFSFFGNKASAGLGLQILLQTLSVFLLYYAVKLLSGRAEALCTLAVLAFLPVYMEQIYCLTPETFYFFLFTVSLVAVGLCKRENEKGKRGKPVHAVFFSIGILIGIMGYLDAAGFVLLLFVGGICAEEAATGERGRKGRNRRREKYKSAGNKFLFCLFGMLAAFFTCLLWDGMASGSALADIWNTWLGVYGTTGIFHFTFGLGSNAVSGIVLCFCALLGLVGFWFHKIQKQDIWVLYLVAMTFWNMVSGEVSCIPSFLIFGWAVLAGIGIASMKRNWEGDEAVRALVPELVLEDMDEAAEEEAVETERITETGKITETEKISETGKITETDKPEIGRKVKLIENPLPLPKKHERREMDFDRIVEWEKMKFDTAVDETDDFDV